VSTLDAGMRRSHGQSYETITRVYNRALATAFGLAAGDSSRGDSLAARARRAVLDNLILPYDALYGQAKADGAIDEMFGTVRAEFTRWISDSSAVPAAARARVLAVNDGWLGVLSGIHRGLLLQWKDSRLVWLAPQLALMPEQYDIQSDVDALIGRAVGHTFTDSNSFGYLRTAVYRSRSLAPLSPRENIMSCGRTISRAGAQRAS